ncbi:hypothetical protein Tco_0902141 [Tanacetum coccineum]
MFDVGTLTGDEVFAEQEVAAKDVNLTVDEVTLAQALAALKSVKPKVKGDAIKEPSILVSTASASTKVSAATTTTTTIPTPRKGIVITELGTPTTTISSQPSQDKEAALKLKAEFDEEERLAREKDEANVALTEEWDDMQAKIEADHELDQKLQAKEQEQFTIEQKATLFKELLEQRRKHFAAKRAEKKRNKPPTKTQQKKTMITYLKNMEEVTKKQKVDDFQETAEVDNDQEAAKIKELMEIVSDEEKVAIDVIPLAVKSLRIVDWKIHKEGKKSYYQIIRADGKSHMYKIFSQMIKSFDREDLEDLYKLVKARYGSTKPVEDLDLVLWNDFKIMFEPHVEDTIWRNQQEYKVLEWKLYDFCRVHSMRMQHMHIYMLVEKKYPLAPLTLSKMLEKKLQIDYESEMAYQLCKLITKQLKNQ